jgi:hypothetical protein
MKIKEALPYIFKRTYPVLENKTQLLVAGSLLRFHQIDAIPIGFQKKQKKHFAVAGYSCLSKLAQIDPTRYRNFLEGPCENAAQELSRISSDAEIVKLFRLFDKSGFGFAMVEGRYEQGALVSLRDLLSLYEKGITNTALTIGQVGSPILSMPRSSTLREVLSEMFRRRFRRIFLEANGKENMITDRRIISYLFSTARLDEISTGSSSDILDTAVENLDTMQPTSLPGNTKVKDAAAIMTNQIEECLVSDKAVITPWDLIMKPWKLGKLRLKESNL